MTHIAWLHSLHFCPYRTQCVSICFPLTRFQIQCYTTIYKEILLYNIHDMIKINYLEIYIYILGLHSSSLPQVKGWSLDPCFYSCDMIWLIFYSIDGYDTTNTSKQTGNSVALCSISVLSSMHNKGMEAAI